MSWCLCSTQAFAQSADAGNDAPLGSKRELTILPTAGGTSDIGFGGGYIASWARVGARVEPYWWRIESAGAFTLKNDNAGKLGANYVDVYALLDFPNVLKNRLGVKARLSFTRERALKFYGLGNAAAPPPETPTSELAYTRSHPTLAFDGEARWGRFGRLYWGAAYTYNWFTIPAESLLARTMRDGTDQERALLGGADRHGVATFSQGVGWDDRDDQTSTHRGQFHDVRWQLSPGNGSQKFGYRFGRVTGTARFYVPIVFERVTLAARLVADALFGDVPFYELARFDDTYAIGGSKGVRGVPAQRYHGKLKIFSNLELRTELLYFRAFDKANALGLTAFFDSGRVWADYARNAALDGQQLGLKYGAGLGLRWAAGKAFVLRADVAWSPDAEPVGGYLTAGQLF